MFAKSLAGLRWRLGGNAETGANVVGMKALDNPAVRVNTLNIYMLNAYAFLTWRCSMTVREVDEPMRFALEQAWEAFVSGSFPVGAALVDAGGVVVAVGRNRMGESSAPDGRLRSTGLAHAEMDVLSQLPMGDCGGHTLVTTLEPCLLCRSAATMAHVGKVQFLAADSICDGLDELPRINQHAGRWYPDMQGPSTGVATDFASILPMAVLLLFGPTGDAAAHYRIHNPREFAVADVMARENRWPSRELTVDAAIAHVAALVASIAGA